MGLRQVLARISLDPAAAFGTSAGLPGDAISNRGFQARYDLDCSEPADLNPLTASRRAPLQTLDVLILAGAHGGAI